MCVSERKHRGFPLSVCLLLVWRNIYHPGQNSKSAVLFYKLVTQVGKDCCRLYANTQHPRFLSASSSHSAEKYFWHILSVSFVNQRMRCWKAHSTVKPLPSTRPNNLPDKSWAHSSGSQVKRAACSRSPTFWSFSSLKSTYTSLCGLVTECLLESGRQSCVKDVPGINNRWLFVFILASGFCYRMQQDGGFMKESLGETLREGFSCVYNDWGEPITG